MRTTAGLTLPSLSRGRFACSASAGLQDDREGEALFALTDETLWQQTGVRIAFTERGGGQSQGAFASLNLATHVHDDAATVERNRALLLRALGFADASLLMCNQVHGSHVVCVDRHTRSLNEARAQAMAGADALAIDRGNTAALLCFADCTPVIIVAPGGAFAVAHAGWRGVMAHTALAALDQVLRMSGAAPDACNAYIGPYIHSECFEVSEQIARDFSDSFGSSCTPDARHVDMGRALRTDLAEHGIAENRIADAGVCTRCENERFYSYRGQGGTCGRHGAIAVRRPDAVGKED